VAYVLEPAAPVSREVKRVASERIAEAISILEHVEGAAAGDIEQAVHDVRKRCKEVRSVARLVRESIGAEFDRFNHLVRDAADTLAPIRDAHALLGTFDDLRATSDRHDDADLLRVREGQADAAHEATRTVHAGDPRITEAHRLLVEAHQRIGRWDLTGGFHPLAAGIENTYRSGRRALRRARTKPTDDRLHAWRTSVKHLWYQTRLIEQAAPSVLTPLIATLDDLAEALGDDHDLAVLIERLAADPDRFGGKRTVERARRLARAEQDELRRRAFRLGATIYTEPPSAFVERIRAYWDRAVRDGPELATGGIAELAADETPMAAHGRPDGAPSTLERERKFLVDTVPALSDPGTELRQGYLAIDGSVSVRVRDAGDEGCTLTVKAGRGAVRTELEFPLTPDQFAAAWEQTGGRRIHKTRHRLAFGDHQVEIDVFLGDLTGLVLAEVEFESDASMTAFEPPAWFATEVTDDVAYTNASLAVNAPRGRPTDTPAT
jgi:CYTH domain-containing protein/CHAD domain-containing protein